MLEFFEHYSVSCASCPKNHESVDLRGGGEHIYIYICITLLEPQCRKLRKQHTWCSFRWLSQKIPSCPKPPNPKPPKCLAEAPNP